MKTLKNLPKWRNFAKSGHTDLIAFQNSAFFLCSKPIKYFERFSTTYNLFRFFGRARYKETFKRVRLAQF